MEDRWRQRSRYKWLQLGDKNTRFFHAYASARMRRNMVQSLLHNGVLHTNIRGIKGVFLEHMKSALGQDGEVLEFDPSILYGDQLDLRSLQDEFTEEEVRMAVKQLARNKSSGPDGLTNEFLQQYWEMLQPQVMQCFQQFYYGQLNLMTMNRANIVMIPKKKLVENANDFRPISIISLIPKLISKVLSNRLRMWLPKLISANQTAFVKDRHIAESFIATREILHHISK